MSKRLDAQAVASAIRQRLAEVGDADEWDAVRDVVKSEIDPLLAVMGAESVIEELVEAKGDPLIAAVLVQLAGETWDLVSQAGDPLFRVDDLFTDDEIVDAALDYVTRIDDDTATLFHGAWGWTTLWSGLGKLTASSHLRLLRELIRRAPDDERVLWMIRDGPVSELLWGQETPPEEARELVSLARDDPKLAQVIAFAADGDPPSHKSP